MAPGLRVCAAKKDQVQLIRKPIKPQGHQNLGVFRFNWAGGFAMYLPKRGCQEIPKWNFFGKKREPSSRSNGRGEWFHWGSYSKGYQWPIRRLARKERGLRRALAGLPTAIPISGLV
jgi:hypothetical protein